jgi:hypothetical protein
VRSSDANRTPATSIDGETQQVSWRQRLTLVLSWLIVVLLNVTAVVLANAGFVYVSVYDVSRYHLIAVQVALAVFKYG